MSGNLDVTPSKEQKVQGDIRLKPGGKMAWFRQLKFPRGNNQAVIEGQEEGSARAAGENQAGLSSRERGFGEAAWNTGAGAPALK